MWTSWLHSLGYWWTSWLQMWDLCCRCEIPPVKDLLFQSPVSCTWVLRCPSWFVTVGGWLYAIWFVTLRCWEYASWARRVSGYGHTHRIVAVFEELGTARLRRVRCRHHDTGFFYVFAKLCTAEPSSISFRFHDGGHGGAGSASSLRSLSRLGSALSVVGFLQLGPPSSLRTYARLG